MRRALLFCVLAGCVLAADLLSPQDLPAGRWATPPTPAPSVADTLDLAVPAGETLVADLPDALGGRAVAEYRIVRAPALSWVVGRSFFWQTRAEDAGRHRLFYEARFQTDPPDTVAVFVTVE